MCLGLEVEGKLDALRNMPRATRVEHLEAIRHAMDREDLCVNDVDLQDSLKTLAEARQNRSWQVHAIGPLSRREER